MRFQIAEPIRYLKSEKSPKIVALKPTIAIAAGEVKHRESAMALELLVTFRFPQWTVEAFRDLASTISLVLVDAAAGEVDAQLCANPFVTPLPRKGASYSPPSEEAKKKPDQQVLLTQWMSIKLQAEVKTAEVAPSLFATCFLHDLASNTIGVDLANQSVALDVAAPPDIDLELHPAPPDSDEPTTISGRLVLDAAALAEGGIESWWRSLVLLITSELEGYPRAMLLPVPPDKREEWVQKEKRGDGQEVTVLSFEGIELPALPGFSYVWVTARHRRSAPIRAKLG